MRQARILVITRNLPPLKGGIERLMQHAVAELGSAFDCDIIGPAGCRPFVPEARQVWELAPRLPWFHAGALLRLLRSSNYDLVVAGNGLMAPLAAFAALRSRCPYTVFVHGLDVIVPNAIYQRTFVPWIRRADAVIANSRYTASLAEQRGVPAARIRVIHPGVEPAPPGDGAAFRAKHQLDGRPLLLSVGRLVPRKGVAEFIDRALPSILRAHPNACFVVIGDEPQHAATDATGTRAAIKAACAAVPGSAVLLLGEVSDEELAQAYAAADVFVFPVLALPGDVEGFGMVALEAASHGVPTVAFDVGGVADAVRHDGTGWMIRKDDYAAMSEAVTRLLSDERLRHSMAQAARQRAQLGSWSIFGEAVRAIARELM